MSDKKIQEETQNRMQEAFSHIQEKVKKVRTGLAHASLVESIKISCYGGEQELKHIAAISCPSARSILISPWDKSVLQNISAALIKSNLGMTPVVEQKIIRLKVPELTEDRKIELIKVFKKDVEKARVEFRYIRKTMNETVRKTLKHKEISEDIAKEQEKDIQKITDQFIKDVNELSEKKQQELMRV